MGWAAVAPGKSLGRKLAVASLMALGVTLVACGAPATGVLLPATPSPTSRLTTATLSLATEASEPAPTATAPAVAVSSATRPTFTVTPSPTTAGATATATPTRASKPTAMPASCRLGMGLRRETEPLITRSGGQLGLVMCATIGLAETVFPELAAPVRVLGAPSLSELARKAERASQLRIPYEALAYGLETSQSTPDSEWQDLVGSTREARAIADQYGKLLVMGPGYQLMSRNWEAYPTIASLADIWVLQTQQLQKEPPGPAYRAQVERVVGQIRSGNPDILIWAQITLPPDRAPNAQEWLSYHDLVADLVDGRTYLGVYTWERVDTQQLLDTMRIIYDAVCDGG